MQAIPGGAIELLPNPRPDRHLLESPGVANELLARQLLFPQTELAANPGGHVLIEPGVEAGGELGSAAPEKAEDP